MEKRKYHPGAVEKKWQSFWKENKTFKASKDSKKPKYYILDMFPYPSGAGLHVGHVVGYTATDIMARYKRAKGFNVLHPMGWDSFGLPAEQYAIRTGTHPRETTKKNIATYKRQLESLGFSYDWDREIATSEPSYYKWTQWIFTKLFEKGLAYEADMLVNYCPFFGTVLANEEVENGVSKEGGHPVERRPLRQWVLKITAYADRLLKDLDLLDWPENLKKLQSNWIGRSEGAHIFFPIEHNPKESIDVFTTCSDTIFGVSYLVLAPEHPLVKKITTDTQKHVVEAYLQEVARKGDLERTDLAKDKTGVFTGAYALNPVAGTKIPIWIADYVLLGYGTGAVMGVPAHDERDFEFATKYSLPKLPVIMPEDQEAKTALEKGELCWSQDGRVYNSQANAFSLNGLTNQEAKKKAIEEFERIGCGKSAVSYKLRDWLFSRQRYWGEPIPILHFADGTKRALELDELPLIPPDVENYKPLGTGESPLAGITNWVNTTDPKTGKEAKRETNTMPQWAGSCWYYLRFCDPLNTGEAWSKDAENYWMPVDMYVGGAEHAVLHLLYSRFWHKVLYDLKLVSHPEPFQALFNPGMMTAPSFQTSMRVYVDPTQVEEKEGEHFHISTGEKLRTQVDKMSKSKLNGVAPDEVIEEFGADALRLYEMFMGPLDKEKVWNTEAVSGCRRFLNRFYDMVTSEKISDETNEEALKLTHRLIHHVIKEVEAMQFNTAIAKMMEFLNAFIHLPIYPTTCVKWAVQCLAPFAPHMAEELWEMLGEKPSVVFASFPTYDEKYLVDATTLYIVQVNGKLRGKFDLPKDQSQEQMLELAKAHPHISKYLEEGKLQRVVFVPNKLLNIVIE